jgi:hypothetical protein
LYSQFTFMIDTVLDGDSPENQLENPRAYTLFQFQQTLATIRAMRDTTSYLVTQIESRFRGCMDRASPCAVELLSHILGALGGTPAQPSYHFPGLGHYIAELAWFCEDWGVILTAADDDAVLVIPDSTKFALSPHVCEAASLKLVHL